MTVRKVKYGTDQEPLYHIYINQGEERELRYLESSEDVKELNRDAEYIKAKLPASDTFQGDYGHRLDVPDYDTKRMKEPVNTPKDETEFDDIPF